MIINIFEQNQPPSNTRKAIGFHFTTPCNPHLIRQSLQPHIFGEPITPRNFALHQIHKVTHGQWQQYLITIICYYQYYISPSPTSPPLPILPYLSTATRGFSVSPRVHGAPSSDRGDHRADTRPRGHRRLGRRRGPSEERRRRMRDQIEDRVEWFEMQI